MAGKKFTDRYLRGLKPKPSRYDILEGDGLTLRVYPTGAKVFYYVFKRGGKNYPVKLGQWPDPYSLSDIRQKHRDLITKRKLGEDIRARANEVQTVGDLVTYYIKEYAKPRKRSWKQDKEQLERDVLPRWKDRQAADITRMDVLNMLEEVLPRGNRACNKLLAVVRKMFNFAVSRGKLEHSPCHLIEPMGIERTGDRTLSPAEIKKFWQGVDQCPISGPVRLALKAVLVTGQRPGEVSQMVRDEIEGNWWTIPAARSKNQRAHRVYLTRMAKALMQGDPVVFPSPKDMGLLSTFTLSQSLRRAYKSGAAKHLPAKFTPRDLRRTVGTQLGELGFDSRMIGMVLNHTDPSITRRVYNLAEYDREKKKMMQAWEKRLRSILKC